MEEHGDDLAEVIHANVLAIEKDLAFIGVAQPDDTRNLTIVLLPVVCATDTGCVEA